MTIPTKSEFIKSYLSNSFEDPLGDAALDFLNKNVVLPCRCEEDGCNGWQMVSKSPILLKMECWRNGIEWPSTKEEEEAFMNELQAKQWNEYEKEIQRIH